MATVVWQINGLVQENVLIKDSAPDKRLEIIERFKEHHEAIVNAYETFYNANISWARWLPFLARYEASVKAEYTNVSSITCFLERRIE